ncbi:hypothetical protein BN871_IH_00110 [Paenibacillus sp. P22]|nr:hypothetical protein BN871_IH_00110 [Paenibacillus sp. P22]
MHDLLERDAYRFLLGFARFGQRTGGLGGCWNSYAFSSFPFGKMMGEG